MDFQGFSQLDFDVFSIDGLDHRMAAIQERIQPKFKEIGEILSTDIAMVAGNEMFLHIAKHARRTVNPPKDTWLAVCHDKRGYKKHPHFQIGLFNDHVFFWLAFIYELPNKTEIAQRLINHFDEIIKIIPSDFVISLDHTQKSSMSVETLSEKQLMESLIRFRDVKKAEFLVGRHIMADEPSLQDGEEFVRIAKETFETLIPIYKMAF